MNNDTEPTSEPDTTNVNESVDVAMIGVGAVFGTKQEPQASTAAPVDDLGGSTESPEPDRGESAQGEPEAVMLDEVQVDQGVLEQGEFGEAGSGASGELSTDADENDESQDDSSAPAGGDLSAETSVVAETEAPEEVLGAVDSVFADLARVPASGRKTRSTKEPDAACAAAVDIAREALLEVVPSADLGDHLGAEYSGDRLVVHSFAANLEGYRGWVWKVLVARASRARVVTTCDSWLEPGTDAMLAPAWVPWADRLAPGDVRPTDRLPYKQEDERLMDNRFCTDEETIDDVESWVVDTTKPRVLSPIGVDEAATRWQKNELSGATRSARQANAACGTCGFFVAITGVLGQQFGVCANGWSDADSNVVNVDYGCGAHSETDVDRESEPISEPVLDESGFEVITD